MASHLGCGIGDGCSGVPRVSFAPAAVRDLERLRAFLESKSPAAARRGHHRGGQRTRAASRDRQACGGNLRIP